MNTSEFVAGTLGGGAGIAVGQPLDTIRVRLQTSKSVGFFATLSRTLSNEGVLGLYRGLVPPLAGIAGVNCLLFGVYGNAKSSLAALAGRPNDATLPLPLVYLAGAYGGAAACVLTTPIELIKCRQQVATGRSLSALEHANRIVASEGVLALYTGLPITLIRDVPSYGLYYACYEWCARWLASRRQAPASVSAAAASSASSSSSLSSSSLALGNANVDASNNYSTLSGQLPTSADTSSHWYRFVTSPAAIDSLVGGGVAGTVAWVSIYPLDVIKSRLQAQSARPQAQRQYAGIADCTSKILQHEGWRGFTRGLSATVFRAFPVNAVTFFVYELTKLATEG
ncbi:hypothetical protein CAOG_01328 [Capsaspora owczarzaki ATCC 30864]|uniref:hypothetical protein n=1 Tax=Capsaspora owczarzaki (strain ATCC 30864) TaxID=595528 RepID=UPI0003521FEB|nr:hypothetical protein CAOG_01328 [Capsaspora owczarzaki ATCC 30864]|eukprot:XP_004349848.2 hypothetical protein CAOG_01328 [Capsaspora owczarzaki ATCC 30864]